MESGTARIVFGQGSIRADTGPSPVAFDIHSFSHIVHGSAVYFQRSESNPKVAVTVVLASEMSALLALARPPAGFTADAEAIVAARAARLLTEVQFMPTAALARAHLNHAKGRMASISQALAVETQPIDPVALASHL